MSEPIWLKVGPLTQYHGPEWLKEAWQGCELPCEEQKETTTIKVSGILLKDYEQPKEDCISAGTQEIPGYCVRQDAALAILGKKLPAAALWYRDLCYPQPNGYFLLEKHDVEICKPVESKAPILTLR